MWRAKYLRSTGGTLSPHCILRQASCGTGARGRAPSHDAGRGPLRRKLGARKPCVSQAGSESGSDGAQQQQQQ